MKKGEIVIDKMAIWFLLLLLLILILVIVFNQKERMLELIESLKNALRFGG